MEKSSGDFGGLIASTPPSPQRGWKYLDSPRGRLMQRNKERGKRDHKRDEFKCLKTKRKERRGTNWRGKEAPFACFMKKNMGAWKRKKQQGERNYGKGGEGKPLIRP